MYCGLIETTNMSALPKELVPAETDSEGNQLLNPSVPTEFFSINGQVNAYGGIYGTTDDYKLKIFFTGVEEQIDIAGKFQYGATVSEDLNPGETYTITYVPGGSVSFTVTPDSDRPLTASYGLNLSGYSGGPTTYYWSANMTRQQLMQQSGENAAEEEPTVESEEERKEPDVVFPYSDLTITTDSAMGVWINEQNQTITTAYGDNTGPFLSLGINYSTRDENGKALSEFVQAAKDDVVTDENGITTITIRGTKGEVQAELSFLRSDAVADTVSHAGDRYSYITGTIHVKISDGNGGMAKNIQSLTDASNAQNATFTPQNDGTYLWGMIGKQGNWQFIGTVYVGQVQNDPNLMANSCFAYGGSTGDAKLQYQLKKVFAGSNSGEELIVCRSSTPHSYGEYMYLIVDPGTYETAKKSNAHSWFEYMEGGNSAKPASWKLHVFNAPCSEFHGSMFQSIGADGNGGGISCPATIKVEKPFEKTGTVVSNQPAFGRPLLQWKIQVNLTEKFAATDLEKLDEVTISDQLNPVLKLVDGSVEVTTKDGTAVPFVAQTQGKLLSIQVKEPAKHPNFTISFNTECMTSIDGLCNSADLMVDGKKVEEAESPSIDKLKVHGQYGSIQSMKIPKFTPEAWKYVDNVLCTEDGKFQFQLTAVDAEGNPLTGADAYTETRSNGADGKIQYSTIKYRRAGTYYYQVKELGDDIEDTRIFTVQVDVVKTENGYVVSSMVTSPENYEAVRFDNTTKPKTTAFTVRKVWDDHDDAVPKRSWFICIRTGSPIMMLL